MDADETLPLEAAEVRARAVIEQLRPYVQAEGGDVTFVHLDGSRLLIRLLAPHNGCASLALVQRLGIERRVTEEVPAIERVDLA